MGYPCGNHCYTVQLPCRPWRNGVRFACTIGYTLLTISLTTLISVTIHDKAQCHVHSVLKLLSFTKWRSVFEAEGSKCSPLLSSQGTACLLAIVQHCVFINQPLESPARHTLPDTPVMWAQNHLHCSQQACDLHITARGMLSCCVFDGGRERTRWWRWKEKNSFKFILKCTKRKADEGGHSAHLKPPLPVHGQLPLSPTICILCEDSFLTTSPNVAHTLDWEMVLESAPSLKLYIHYLLSS